MEKKSATIIIIVLILAFAGYIVIDLTLKQSKQAEVVAADTSSVKDAWFIEKVLETGIPGAHALATSTDGRIYIGGERSIKAYKGDLSLLWEVNTDTNVTALAISADKVYAAMGGRIITYKVNGDRNEEWGPYATDALITSVSSNGRFTVFADAFNRNVFIIDQAGNLKSKLGSKEDPFIIPSPYFDVAIDDHDTVYVANTGNRRIEKRSLSGELQSWFGQGGSEPGFFCGCCNPANFVLVPGGYVTAEKGINRLSFYGKKGDFKESVSSVNKFIAAHPLDLASPDGSAVYALNPVDSKVYIFKRLNDEKK